MLHVAAAQASSVSGIADSMGWGIADPGREPPLGDSFDEVWERVGELPVAVLVRPAACDEILHCISIPPILFLSPAPVP